jgi:hypothetical protein
MDQAMVEQSFRLEIDEHPWVRLFGPPLMPLKRSYLSDIQVVTTIERGPGRTT